MLVLLNTALPTFNGTCIGVKRNAHFDNLSSIIGIGNGIAFVIDLLERFSRYTLVQAILETGRTHQIRAHLAALGHPVLGDDLYGDRNFNRREKARSLKLCAVSLKLDTEGRLPHLDGREFTITPPF